MIIDVSIVRALSRVCFRQSMEKLSRDMLLPRDLLASGNDLETIWMAVELLLIAQLIL